MESRQLSRLLGRFLLKKSNCASYALDRTNLPRQFLNGRCNHRLAANGALRCVAARIVRYPFRTIVYFFTNSVSAMATISPRSELPEIGQGFMGGIGFIQFDLTGKMSKFPRGWFIIPGTVLMTAIGEFSEPAFFFWDLIQDFQPRAHIPPKHSAMASS